MASWAELCPRRNHIRTSVSTSMPPPLAQTSNMGVDIGQIVAVPPHAERGKFPAAAWCRRALVLDAHKPCPRLAAIRDRHGFASVQARQNISHPASQCLGGDFHWSAPESVTTKCTLAAIRGRATRSFRAIGGIRSIVQLRVPEPTVRPTPLDAVRDDGVRNQLPDLLPAAHGLTALHHPTPPARVLLAMLALLPNPNRISSTANIPALAPATNPTTITPILPQQRTSAGCFSYPSRMLSVPQDRVSAQHRADPVVIPRLMFRPMARLAPGTSMRVASSEGRSRPGHLKEYMLCAHRVRTCRAPRASRPGKFVAG